MNRRKFLALLSTMPFILWGLKAAQAEPITITKSNLTIIGPKFTKRRIAFQDHGTNIGNVFINSPASSRAFRTVREALDHCRDGDTILVYPNAL